MDRRSFLLASASSLAAAGLPGRALAALGPGAAETEVVSNFHRIYGNQRTADRFFLFLKNIFHLFPEDRFHQLVLDSVAAHDTDEAIYQAIQDGLPTIKTVGSELTYALPALQKQKEEMAKQTAMLLSADDRKHYDGYLEIGTTGRYIKPIGALLPLAGPTFLVNDIAPGTGPIDVIERGALGQIAEFKPLGNYDRIDLPEQSLDLVTNFIGFHHAPLDRVEDFIDSVRTVLRPGGRLVVRDHDVDGSQMDTFVALAHDVFNAGVFLSWADNAKEIRHFRSKEEWTAILAAAGFERDDKMLAQAHDPTDNVLMAFRRV